MKVRQEDGNWVVREEDGAFKSTHPTKTDALLEIGYRGRTPSTPIKQSPKRARKEKGNAKARP